MNEHKSVSTRIVSSLEKGLLNDRVEDHPALSFLSALTGEEINVQLFVCTEPPAARSSRRFEIMVDGGKPEEIYEVKQIYADLPLYRDDPSAEQGLAIISPSGLYPDLLVPLGQGGFFRPAEQTLASIWFTFRFDTPGKRRVTISLIENGERVSDERVDFDIINEKLPPQKLIFTQWFHCDCLASYYGVPVFSEEHWRIIGNFMKEARRRGINCIFTPIFTPPLDTAAGTERPTVQLVGVSLDRGVYSFDFSLLKRWIDLAKEVGMEYFEISHLFTQWGAIAAPKIVAAVDGEQRRIFGWDTPSGEGEYPAFLSVFLPRLTAFLRSEGIIGSCRFHISDEPGENHIECYKKAVAAALPCLEGCKVIDAASSLEMFRQGIIKIPVPGINKNQAFLNEDIPERWGYYCCGQWDRVSNRFMAYPSFRNRIIGVQLYKYAFDGFLQWGYNFYYSMLSLRAINPYISTSGDCQVPSGDAFSVYPGQGGVPLPSLRLLVFKEALDDMRALEKCEEYIGRDAVINLIDSLAGMNVTFFDYPASAEYLLALRAEINRIISEKTCAENASLGRALPADT